MRKNDSQSAARVALAGTVISAIALAAIVLSYGSRAFALEESPAAGSSASESGGPPPPPPDTMRVVPSEEEGAAPAPSEEGAASAPAPAKKHRTTHHASAPPEVEPAKARLKVKQDAWIYSGPSKWTKHITRAQAGKFVNITGSTKYYLQVKMKDGQTGYIAPSDVELVTPTDKVFTLTHDAPVLNEPNHWARSVSKVHQGRSVHIVGMALNYMQIRMKSGSWVSFRRARYSNFSPARGRS